MRACFGQTHLKLLDCELIAVVTAVGTTLPQVFYHTVWLTAVGALVSSWEAWQQNRNLLTDWPMAREMKLCFTKWVSAAFPRSSQSYLAALTTKWIRCCAVPLLFISILPEALHQVWIGVLQRSPSHGPLLQPPHPILRPADEVWPEELQSLLRWVEVCIQ